MGRHSTGANAINEARKLDLRIMLNDGSIKNGSNSWGIISWNRGPSLIYKSCCTGVHKFLRVLYTVIDINGSETSYDYKINIETIPSNLGEGDVLYFECPKTHQLARVLYQAYKQDEFLHRDYYLDVYGRRLYYNSQIASKNDYQNTRYFNVKAQVDRLEESLFQKYRKIYYRGQPTKEYQKLLDLKVQMNLHDQKRLGVLAQWLNSRVVM